MNNEVRFYTLEEAVEKGIPYKEQTEHRCDHCGELLEQLGFIGYDGVLVRMMLLVLLIMVLLHRMRGTRLRKREITYKRNKMKQVKIYSIKYRIFSRDFLMVL